MPIALESRVEIDRTTFDRKVVIVEPPEIKKFMSPAAEAEAAEGAWDPTCSPSSSSSSSIGKNSESCGSDGEGLAGEEVESAYKGPLNALESLEESLPFREKKKDYFFGLDLKSASEGEKVMEEIDVYLQ